MSEDESGQFRWSPSRCEGSPHCPPRCPRFRDPTGVAWVVRPARGADRTGLVEMYEGIESALLPLGGPRNAEAGTEWIDRVLSEGCNYVAVRGDEVGGHALYAPADDAAPAFGVVVRSTYRDRGLARELSKHVLAAATVANREALTLVADSGDPPVQGLYDDLGFRIVEQSTYSRRGRQTGVVRMRCDLSTADATRYCRPPIVRNGPIES